MTKTFSKSLTDRLLRNLLDELEGSDDPSFTPEQIDLLEQRIFEIREALLDEAPQSETPELSAEAIHKALAERNQTAVIWDIEDVQVLRPDLSDEQAWRVLEQVERHHDAGIGINWEVLEAHAEALFPEPEGEAEESPVHSESLNNPSKGIDQ